MYDASGHSLEDIQNYHILYGLVKVCTGNRAVTEKWNNFFKECRITDTWCGTFYGNGEITLIRSASVMAINPAFGGVIYQRTTGGTVRFHSRPL